MKKIIPLFLLSSLLFAQQSNLYKISNSTIGVGGGFGESYQHKIFDSFAVPVSMVPSSSQQFSIDDFILFTNHQSHVELAEQFFPTEFKLMQNYPNPFNPQTTIEFTVPQTCKIYLAIYNANSQLINSFEKNNIQPGQHSIVWNGTNSKGLTVATGIYFYQIIFTYEHQIHTTDFHKMIFLK